MFPFVDSTFPKHYYSVVLSDSARHYDRTFVSRNEATEAMRKQCRKMGVSVVEVWDDNHEKTSICNDGSQFHINRN